MNEVFKTIGINFYFCGDVVTVEMTPRWGNVRIIGTGAKNEMDFHCPAGNPEEMTTEEDLDNFIAALKELKREVFGGDTLE